MRLARIVFITAGIWGILVLTPLYFLWDVSGRRYAAPADYPHFFYGFLGVAMAWQVAFLIIGSNPSRFRPLMIPGIIEKFGFVATIAVLYSGSAISAFDASVAIPDVILGMLFVVAFMKTRPEPA